MNKFDVEDYIRLYNCRLDTKVICSFNHDQKNITLSCNVNTCYKYIYQLSQEKLNPHKRKFHNLKYGFIMNCKTKDWIHLIRHNTKPTIRKFKC